MRQYMLGLLLVVGSNYSTASLLGDDAIGCFDSTSGCTPAPFTIGAGPEFTTTFANTIFTVDFTGALGNEISFLFENTSSTSLGGYGSRTLLVDGLDWMPGYIVSELTLLAGAL